MHPFGDLFFAGGLRLSCQDHYKRVLFLGQHQITYAESGIIQKAGGTLLLVALGGGFDKILLFLLSDQVDSHPK